MNEGLHTEENKKIYGKNWQLYLSMVPLFLVLNLGLPKNSSAQQNKIQQNTQQKDTVENKGNTKERTEINKLRNTFAEGPYGSDHFMGILNGKFVDKNGKINHNNRPITTIYDYLILNNNILSLLINLGFTTENIKFLSTKDIPNTHPYKLGYLLLDNLKENDEKTDSIYKEKKSYSVTKKYITKNYYEEDSTQNVEVSLAGVKCTIKTDKEHIVKLVKFPQIDGTGTWKDANNFDLAYEITESIFEQNKNEYDIQKREFSKHTPKEVKEIILKHFDSKHQPKVNTKEIKGSNPMNTSEECFDLINKPNGAIVKIGTYEFLHYFGDEYFRNTKDNQENKNPLWHNVFQNDEDMEKQNDGWIDFVMLHYGTKNYIMPTLVPRNLPKSAKLMETVMYYPGVEKESYRASDDMKYNILNGRLVNKDLVEYESGQGILSLSDGGIGTIDRIYRVYNYSKKKLCRIFVYCDGQTRGGVVGELSMDQLITTKKKYDDKEYRKFVEYIDLDTFLATPTPYIKQLENFVKKTSGANGKTIPVIDMTVTKINPKKNNKEIKTTKTIKFESNKIATIYPDNLIVGWDIVGNSSDIRISILDNTIGIKDLPTFLENTEISTEEISKNNANYQETIAKIFTQKTINKPNPDEIYENKIYDLTDIGENKLLIENIIASITGTKEKIENANRLILFYTQEKENIVKSAQEKEKTGEANTPEYTQIKQKEERTQVIIDEYVNELERLKTRKNKLIGSLDYYYTIYLGVIEKASTNTSAIISGFESQIADISNEITKNKKGKDPNKYNNDLLEEKVIDINKKISKEAKKLKEIQENLEEIKTLKNTISNK